MIHYIEYKMEDASVIIFEVDKPETGGTTRASRRPAEFAEEAKETYEQLLSKFCSAIENVITTLHGLAQRHDEIEMEFEFNLSATAGVVIASASTQANYKVTFR